MSHLSNVWFKVTDLQVTHGRGCRVTTVERRRVPRLRGRHRRQLDRSLPTRRWRAAIAAQARALHPRPDQRLHPRPRSSRWPPSSPRSRPARIDTFFFANSGRRDHRGRGQARQAGHASARTSIVFQGSFHGRTHMAMAMTTSKTGYRAGHAPLPAGVFVSPFPDPLADDQDAAVDVGAARPSTACCWPRPRRPRRRP